MTKRRILLAAAALLLLIQFIPVDRSNPPVETEIPAPEHVRTILRESCYDCHSYQTRWPWYSRIAPVSWLVAHDVEEAREHLDLSAWNRYAPARQAKLQEEIWEEVEEGEMPLWFYLPLHPSARLTDGERQVLHQWVEESLATPPRVELALQGEGTGETRLDS